MKIRIIFSEQIVIAFVRDLFADFSFQIRAFVKVRNQMIGAWSNILRLIRPQRAQLETKSSPMRLLATVLYCYLIKIQFHKELGNRVPQFAGT